jgi:hypothetical protein
MAFLVPDINLSRDLRREPGPGPGNRSRKLTQREFFQGLGEYFRVEKRPGVNFRNTRGTNRRRISDRAMFRACSVKMWWPNRRHGTRPGGPEGLSRASRAGSVNFRHGSLARSLRNAAPWRRAEGGRRKVILQCAATLGCAHGDGREQLPFRIVSGIPDVAESGRHRRNSRSVGRREGAWARRPRLYPITSRGCGRSWPDDGLLVGFNIASFTRACAGRRGRNLSRP